MNATERTRLWRRANPEAARAIMVRQMEKEKAKRKALRPVLTPEERELIRREQKERYNANRRVKYRADEKRRRSILDRNSSIKFGISATEYASMRMRPCEICGVFIQPTGRNQGMHIDHDHLTGRVRGTLCPSCNLGLGKFGDRLDLLRRAVEYMEGTR